jgi:hypothetical protein
MSADEAARAGRRHSFALDLQSMPPAREGPIVPRIFNYNDAGGALQTMRSEPA